MTSNSPGTALLLVQLRYSFVNFRFGPFKRNLVQHSSFWVTFSWIYLIGSIVLAHFWSSHSFLVVFCRTSMVMVRFDYLIVFVHGQFGSLMINFSNIPVVGQIQSFLGHLWWILRVLGGFRSCFVSIFIVQTGHSWSCLNEFDNNYCRSKF